VYAFATGSIEDVVYRFAQKATSDYVVVMPTPRSVRLSDDVLHRLSDLSRRRGASVSSTIERLLDEALRREAHPGITFRDGPSGRRAGLVVGPDVDEVIRTLRAVQEEGAADGVVAVAETTSLTEAQVRAAVAYYADHRAEIDERIAANDRAAEELEVAWRRQQEILAGPPR
jgi:predicted transcriptional regulator